MAHGDEVEQAKLKQRRTTATGQLGNWATGQRGTGKKRDMSIRLHLPETRFAVASIPLEQYGEVVSCLSEIDGFVSLIRDKEEITLIVAEDVWERFAPRFPGARTQEQRRMIRFDTVLDFSVVGFISEISGALADADISILSLSTYSTDAVFVHESRFDDAVSAVKQALVTLRFTHLAQH
jgi:uncharacterized protein